MLFIFQVSPKVTYVFRAAFLDPLHQAFLPQYLTVLLFSRFLVQLFIYCPQPQLGWKLQISFSCNRKKEGRDSFNVSAQMVPGT